jgi:hypothetical protein
MRSMGTWGLWLVWATLFGCNGELPPPGAGEATPASAAAAAGSAITASADNHPPVLVHVDNTAAEPVPVVGSVSVGGGAIAATQQGPWSVSATQEGPWSVSVSDLPPVTLASDTVNVASLPPVSISGAVTLAASEPVYLEAYVDLVDGSSARAFFGLTPFGGSYVIPEGKQLMVDVLSVICDLSTGQTARAEVELFGLATYPLPIALTPYADGHTHTAIVTWPLRVPAGTRVLLSVFRNAATDFGNCRATLGGHTVDAPAVAVP